MQPKHLSQAEEVEKPRRPGSDDDITIVSAAVIVSALTNMPSKRAGGAGSTMAIRQLDKPNIDLRILFDFDLAGISSTSLPQLEEVAKALLSPELRAFRIMVEGHTDHLGSNEYNLFLSRRRAESVRRTLEERFEVPPERLFIRGMGETAPVVTNRTDAGRHRNRRVTFINLDGCAAL